MDKKEQVKFILLVISMTSCVAYSFGMFKLPSPFRKKETFAKPRSIERQVIDHRTDGGGGTRRVLKPNTS